MHVLTYFRYTYKAGNLTQTSRFVTRASSREKFKFAWVPKIRRRRRQSARSVAQAHRN